MIVRRPRCAKILGSLEFRILLVDSTIEQPDIQLIPLGCICPVNYQGLSRVYALLCIFDLLEKQSDPYTFSPGASLFLSLSLLCCISIYILTATQIDEVI